MPINGVAIFKSNFCNVSCESERQEKSAYRTVFCVEVESVLHSECIQCILWFCVCHKIFEFIHGIKQCWYILSEITHAILFSEGITPKVNVVEMKPSDRR